jgi:hypothetical protein
MDAGRQGITRGARDARAFKTPTLRDVALRRPYMHDGRFETLHAVVRYYAEGCGEDAGKDERLKGFAATPAEVDDLVAFLTALGGETRAGLATKRWSRRARTTSLKFVDVNGRPLSGMEVALVPVGDQIPDDKALDERIDGKTNSSGKVSYRPGARTHMRIVLPDELPLQGGDLVPDTCASARLTVPVLGRMSFLLTFAADATPPTCLVGDHPTVAVPRGHPLKRTRFERGPVVTVGGRPVARYEGWVRSDAGGVVRLLVPGVTLRPMAEKLRFALAPDAEVRVDLTDL